MNRIHALGFVVFVTIFFASHERAVAQYCGGTLEYVVRDQGDRLIEALDIEVIQNGPPLISTYIRRPSRANITRHQQEQLKRNNHYGPMLGTIPVPERTDAGNASRKPNNIEGMHLSTFAIRMGCGLPLVELTLKYKGDVMKLRFLNVREMDAVLDALPFGSGTFEIDFEDVYRGYPPDKSKFNTKGLRSGDDLLLPWHAKGFALISSGNWKKVN